MASKKFLKTLTQKVKAGKEISLKDEIIYMTQVLKIPKQIVEGIIAINSNKNPNILID